jgi:5'/3'-nucleotidase SurE
MTAKQSQGIPKTASARHHPPLVHFVKAKLPNGFCLMQSVATHCFLRSLSTEQPRLQPPVSTSPCSIYSQIRSISWSVSSVYAAFVIECRIPFRLRVPILVETALVSAITISLVFVCNFSAAFALSSGTVGAALSAALCGIKSIALSYGTVIHPTPTSLHTPAHRLSGRIITRILSEWGTPFEESEQKIDLYNVNVPMIMELLEQGSLPVYWTRMWNNSYSRLFKPVKAAVNVVEPAGPDSDARSLSIERSSDDGRLTFKFAPVFEAIINPDSSRLQPGTDAWALLQGGASVTPLLASYAEPRYSSELPKAGSSVDQTTSEQWKWKS